MTGMGEVNSN